VAALKSIKSYMNPAAHTQRSSELISLAKNEISASLGNILCMFASALGAKNRGRHHTVWILVIIIIIIRAFWFYGTRD